MFRSALEACVLGDSEDELSSQKFMRLVQVRGCSEFLLKFLRHFFYPLVCICTQYACVFVCYSRQSRLFLHLNSSDEFSLPSFKRFSCSFGHCYGPTIVFFFLFYLYFEKAPSVMVIIWELRGTHILTLTQWYYSWGCALNFSPT